MGRLADAWRLLNSPCRAMTRLASEALDRPLGRLERVALRVHLLTCTSCRRYARQIRVLGRALRTFADRAAADDAPPPPGPLLPDDVRERIKRRLREE